MYRSLFLIVCLLAAVCGCSEFSEIENFLKSDLTSLVKKKAYTLNGKISDNNSGIPIPGVEITLKSDETEQTVKSGPLGEYAFGKLPAGRYRLTCVKKESTYRENSMEIELSGDTGRNIFMSKFLESYCYGGKGNDVLIDMIKTRDGNWLLAGHTLSVDGDLERKRKGGENDCDIWILKINSENGGVMINRCYGGSENDTAAKILETEDGHIAVLGSTYSRDMDLEGLHKGYGGRYSDMATSDIWIFKINGHSGDIIWNRCFGGSQTEYPYDMAEMFGGNLVLAARSTSNDGDLQSGWAREAEQKGYVPPKSGVWLIYVDSKNGNKLYSRHYGTSSSSCAIEPLENEIVLIKQMRGPTTNSFLLEMVLISTAFPARSEILFASRNDGLFQVILESCTINYIKERKSGKFLAAANTMTIAGKEQVWMFEMAPQSNSQKKYKGYPLSEILNEYQGTGLIRAQGIIAADDSCFVLAGTKGEGNDKMALCKIDFDRRKNLFSATYGGSGKDEGKAVIQENENVFILGGDVKSTDGDLTGLRKGSSDDTDIWLVKADLTPETQPMPLEKPPGTESIPSEKQTKTQKTEKKPSPKRTGLMNLSPYELLPK